MPDILNRVTTVYKAETAQAKQAVQTLRGVERERAREVLNDLNAHNSKLQDQIGTLSKVAAVAGTLAGAYALASRSLKSYLEDVRLESAAAGASLGGLQKATHGLVEADDLLAFAGKAMHGTWKLNQEEMERVLHGALALRKTMGVELKPTIDALTDSIAKGNTKALKEFGIEAKDKEGVLRELDGLFQGLHGNVGLAGDAMQASGVKIADTFDDLQGQLGKMVVALSPAIEGLAVFIGHLTDGIKWLDGFTDRLVGVDTQGGTTMQQHRRQANELRAEAARTLSSGGRVAGNWRDGSNFLFPEARAADLERQANQLMEGANKSKAAGRDAIAAATQFATGVEKFGRSVADAFTLASKPGKPGAKPGSKGGGGYKGPAIDFEDLSGAFAGYARIPGGLAEGFGNAYRSNRDAAAQSELAGAGRDIHGSLAEGQAAIEKMVADFERLDAVKKEMADRRDQDFSQIFGEPAQFNAHAEAVNALASSFNVLEQAGGAAYEALVTGSGDTAEAMKKALGNGLLALGKDFFVRALGETAFGIASLVTAPAAAPLHFAAAAAFGAASVAAGVAAGALGAGGGGGNSARPAGAAGRNATSSYLPPGGGGGDVTRNVTIILGDSYDNMTPRERNARLARATKRGFASERSVTFRDS